MTELAGKVALITGSSRGIGAACAREFAEAGMSVVLAARSHDAMRGVAAEIENSGGSVEICVCDVVQYSDVEGAVESAVGHFGRLDILVNNAGIIDPIVRIGESDPEKWGLAVDVNYKGAYHGLRAVLPIMEAQGEGVIINLSSGAAINAFEGWSHYCSSKAALLSLTKCAHLEYFDKGIRVVGLSPGMVATDMQHVIRDSDILSLGPIDTADYISPEWVARAAVWLSSGAAVDVVGEDFSLRLEENRRRVGLVGD